VGICGTVDGRIVSGGPESSATLTVVPASPFPARKSGIAYFGVFEVDLDARELRKQGRRIRLQNQPFSVLAFLLERAGSVVTREDLRSQLWPSDTFVDFDHSVNTAVNKLREVLGDSANSPRFIETLARRGYRFIGEVRWAENSQSPPAAGLSAEPQVSREDDLPAAHRGLTRSLFALIQVMYLIFYLEALLHWQGIDRISWLDAGSPVVLIVVLVSAAVGIPVRFYLLSGVGFDYRRLGKKFQKIFLGILILDQLWAISPFLLLQQIGFGAALAATAALLYVPFGERTLVRMAYPLKTMIRS
jgi:cholera toxin transcriptional activator